jgi:FkbM family methyltransferase
MSYDLIRYFEIGVMDGTVTKVMLKSIFSELNQRFDIYCFEACKKNYKELHNSLSDELDNLYNFAVSDETGLIKLYHSRSKNGHSLCKTKCNIHEDDFEMVRSIKLSNLLIELNGKYADIPLSKSLNILRYNIEGAELNLFRDLDDNNMFQYFDIVSGNFGSDILKCRESKGRYEEFMKICIKNGLDNRYRWDWRTKPLDMLFWIKDVLADTQIVA